jgi:ERF superfamily
MSDSGAMTVRNPFDLLTLAVQNNSAIDVIERLSALQEKAMLRDAEIQFNEAMTAAQAQITRIAPDLENKSTKSKYASYAKLDKVLRPIYLEHGFSLSFNTAESTVPEMVPVLCYVAHKAGHSRTYRIDMPADGKGAKGGEVMTRTHATGSAVQYGMRYLLKAIFNIAIGLDDDGNAAAGLGNGWLAERLTELEQAESIDSLTRLFKAAATRALDEAKDMNAYQALKDAKEKRKAKLA